MRFAMRKLSHLPAMDRERLGEYLDTLEELRATISSMAMDVLQADEETQRQYRKRHSTTIDLPPVLACLRVSIGLTNRDFRLWGPTEALSGA
jgi:hypothetical protein